MLQFINFIPIYITLYSDRESGLASIHFAVGHTPRDVGLLDWIAFPPAEYLSHVFQIPDGSYGWVKLRPVNNGLLYAFLFHHLSINSYN